MTSLEAELKARKISCYKLTQLLGEDPKKKTSIWMRRIKGKETITEEDLRRICAAVNTLTTVSPLDVDDIDINGTRFEIL